jgi:hypothetical protein
MRGSKDKETANTAMDGQKIHYNFIRPHMALNGKTPAEKTRIAKLANNK